MNIPEIFLRELWEIWWYICAVAVGLSIGALVRFALSRSLTFFTRTKSFPELAAFSKDDQKGLLREASREAFSALSFVPVLVFLAVFWVGAAFGVTLWKVTVLPGWVGFVLMVLIGGLGAWLGRRLEAHRLRPFLKKLIGGQNDRTHA